MQKDRAQKRNENIRATPPHNNQANIPLPRVQIQLATTMSHTKIVKRKNPTQVLDAQDYCRLKDLYCTYGQYKQCSAKGCPKGYKSKEVNQLE
jgi:hypothetical protein